MITLTMVESDFYEDSYWNDIDSAEYYEDMGIGPGEDHFDFLYRHGVDFFEAVEEADRILAEGDLIIDDFVLRCLASENPFVRNTACLVLHKLFAKVEAASGYIQKLLTDSDERVRREAALILKTNFSQFSNGELLATQLAQDALKEINGIAFEIFADHVELFENPLSWIRNYLVAEQEGTRRAAAGAAVSGLAKILTPNELITTLWEGSSNELKIVLLNAISFYKRRLNSPHEWIIAALNESDPEVVCAALSTFGKLYYSIPNHQKIIQEMIEKHDDPRVCLYALWIKQCAVEDYEIRNTLGTWKVQQEIFSLDY